MGKPKSNSGSEEYRADSWERFEAAVDIAVKTPAKHRPTTKQKTANKKVIKGKIVRST
jgi:hypothetical protein